MSIYRRAGSVTLCHGDCLSELEGIGSGTVDAVVTDPPYGLSNTSPAQVAETVNLWSQGDREYMPGGRGFMGKTWDGFVPPPAVWDECWRVLKPGGHMLVFAGSRTQDLMGLSIRLAGFEIRDSVAWLYGSGFPKSLDVSRSIDKSRGNQRGTTPDTRNGPSTNPLTKGADHYSGSWGPQVHADSGPVDTDAARWQGWGTALKPAHEPVIMARKPLEGTVAANVLEHGAGALNIDGCRIPSATPVQARGTAGMGYSGSKESYELGEGRLYRNDGRWPANVVVDEYAADVIDGQSGVLKSGSLLPGHKRGAGGSSFQNSGGTIRGSYGGDEGGASRFFYTAKAPKSERPNVDGVQHPTVKPLALMRWLVRMVTPPGGTVLDPFAGSGTTIEAALLEGMNPIGIERETEYLPLIEARIARAQAAEPDLFNEETA